MTEKLIGPALDFEGIIFTGTSHLDVIERIYRVAICIEDGRRMVKLADIGFVTNTGRFVGRVEAKRIAQEVGQPLPWHTGGKRPFASPDGAATPSPAGDGFRFCPELFAHRACVIEALENHGIYWLSDYAAVDLQHDVFGLEVCGLKSREGASRVRDVLKRVFLRWTLAGLYYHDYDRAWRVDIRCR